MSSHVSPDYCCSCLFFFFKKKTAYEIPKRDWRRVLFRSGILERSQNRGVRIVELDETRIDRVCEVRAALETIAARYAIATYRPEPARLQRLDSVLAEMADAVQRRAWAAVNRADLAFH